MSSGLGSQVLSGLRWATLSRVLAQILTWLSTFIVIRLVSPADFGLAALAAVFANFLSMMSEMGLAIALVQKQVRDEETFRRVLGFVVLIGVALCGLLVFAAPLAGQIADDERVIPLVRLVSLQFIAMAFCVVPDARLSIDLRFREIGIVGVTSSVLAGVVTLVLAWRGMGAYSLVTGTVAISVFRAVLLNISCPSIFWPRFDFGKLREFGRFSGLILLQRTIWYWYMSADTFIVGRLLGATQLGIFSLGRQLTTIPLERAMGVINAVAFPAYSKIKDDLGRTRASYLKALRLGAIYAFPVFWGLASVAGPAVYLVVGEKWLPSVPVIQLLCLAMPLRMLNAFTAPAAWSLDRQDVTIKSLIAAVILIPLAILIGQRWGVAGAAMGWAVAFPAVYLIDAWLIKDALELPIEDMFGAIVPPAIAAILMTLVIYLGNRLAMSAFDPWAQLAINIPLGIGAYLVALRLFGRGNMDDALGFIRGMLGWRAKQEPS